MPNNVRVLANDQIITSYNQAEEQDNFLNPHDGLAFTPENFKALIQENIRYRRKVEDLQEKITGMYEKHILKLPPKMEITYKAL
jgi:hypothetical protein